MSRSRPRRNLEYHSRPMAPVANPTRKRQAAFVAAAGVVALLLLGFWMRRPAGGAQYLTAPVQRGAITSVVEATGTINPLTTVPVGSYVSGTVKFIFADFNTRVHAGQVLAQIDPDIYQAQRAQAAGNLGAAQANLRNLEAGPVPCPARIETHQAPAATRAAHLS